MKPSPVRRSVLQKLRLGALALCAIVAAGAPLAASAAGPGVFVVNIPGDTDDKTPGDGVCADAAGKCSLRAAIMEGNALAGATRASPHTITFSVPQVNISNGSFPTMMAPYVVTGPAIINGSGMGTPLSCLSLSDSGTVNLGYTNGANGSIISLLSIVNCGGPGITANGHGYHFFSNHIGVDPSGLVKMKNAGHGISLSASHVYGNVDTTSLDTLFQTFPQIPVQGSDIQAFVQNLKTVLATALDPDTIDGNVISGNDGDGINLSSQNLGAVFVQGNMIGTDTTGNVAIGNGGNGISLLGDTFGNVIGPGNTISGNVGNGININATVYLPNFIMGNRIGLPLATPGMHVGNGISGISATTKPDTSMTNFNPAMISLVVGPSNFISDNQGAPNSTDPDVLPAAGAGIVLTGITTAVKVNGNTIGLAEIPAGTPQNTNAYGNAADGIFVSASGNTIAGNTIAGNKRHGIVTSTTNNTSTHITGNTIGLYPAFAGVLTLGNGFDGIHNDNASSTLIGGPNASDFNVIAGNGRNGVKILDGGTATGWANMLQRNQIYANAQGNPAATPMLPAGAGVGVDLDHAANAPDGPHPEFPASYANLDQAPPVICTGAVGEPMECAGFAAPMSSGGVTNFDWTIATHGPATFRVEFYQLNTGDDNTATSMAFLGEQTVTTDATSAISGCAGNRCSASLPVNTAGSFVMMNVTDVSQLTNQPAMNPSWGQMLQCFLGDFGILPMNCPANNTSEFSNVAAMPLSSNADLANLTISSGMLMPAFAASTLSYADGVGSAVASVTVTPTVSNASATVKVNGTSVTSGTASGAITLPVGPSSTPIMVVVTAQDGTTTQTYTINVSRAGALSNNAALSGLTISSGTLMPSFAAATLTYADSVTSGTGSVTVTPTTADPTATVKVNGTTVTSGTASGAITLPVGPSSTPITVLVTAQDGTTTQTYTINVSRAGALSNNAALSGLTISSGTLMPSFAAATLTYADSVTSGTGSVTVTPTTADPTATVKVNGTTVASGTASGAITLPVGPSSTPITIVVTAQDGTTTQTYTINVSRAGALSNNAALSGLTISSGTLMPSFAAATLTYADSVTSGTGSVTVTPTTADPTATVKVNGTTVTSGTASGAITLPVGPSSTPITILVTAQDGTTTQTYTINVSRAGALSNNAALSGLTISSGTLMPSFAAATLTYADSVTSGTGSVTVTPTTADPTATIKVNGTTVTSGTASGAITLPVGPSSTPITVLVTAQDGTTTQTYTINVSRAGALSNNAALGGLTISSGTLMPSFAAATLTYADSVTSGTGSVTVTPTTADPTATVKVNGTTVTSGTASGAITLPVGPSSTPITVLVTAQDGTTTQTYTVNVSRAGALSNNAALSGLTISSGTLMPSFAAATLTYADSVTSGTGSVTVTPTTADPTATVKVNGTTVTSGTASGAITLPVGPSSTPITVLVTAQDGTTTQTYTVNVSRAGALSNNAALGGLTISSGTLMPSFAAATLTYADSVTSGTGSVTVTPTTADPTATVKVNGTTVTSGTASGAITLPVGPSSTPITVLVTAQDGTTTQTYTVNVSRAGALSNNAALGGLTISSGTLMPSFAAATLTYADSVTSGTGSVTVTPTTADPTATVKVNGTTLTSGTASGAITLPVGPSSTPITIVVTAQDGTTTQTYTINVSRAGALSNNAALGGLTISSGTLMPSFAAATLTYADSVTSGTGSVTVTPTTADPTATVKVNGTTVTSGTASGAITLPVGPSSTPIAIVVTAQDGTTMQTYTVNVSRAGAVVTTFSGTTSTNSGTVTANISGGGATCSFSSAALVGAPAAPPPGVAFPDGLFQFTLVNCVGSVTVHATFPTAFSASEAYYKYGPTPGSPSAHWYALGATNAISLVGNAATFTIADGGLGDDDLTVNGSIVDAGGPAVVAAPSGAVAPTPALSPWALALMTALFGLVGWFATGRRVQRSRAR